MARLQSSPSARVGGALLLVGLAFLAAYGYRLRLQQAVDSAVPPTAVASAPIELDRFAARLEKTNEGERLTVGLRLRASSGEPIDCYVFVVARAERATPRTWAIWPPDSPGMAISAGGHFHAAHPASGHGVTLTGSWERIDAVLPVLEGQAAFDSVEVYVVSAAGNVLVSRPFAL